MALELAQLLGQRAQRLHLGQRAQRLDLHGARRLDDARVAEACALISEETWLCAVLIAASADSTSAGGSIAVISEASSTTP